MKAHCKDCYPSKNLIIELDELLNCTVVLSHSEQLNSAALHLPKLLKSAERHTE